MSQSRGNRAKRFPKFEYIYFAYEVQPFNIDDYVQNPAMIMKLHEEMKIARAASSNLQVRFEELRMDNQRLELQKQELDIKLGEAKKELERLQEDRRINTADFNSLRATREELRGYNHQLEIQNRELDIELKGTKQKLEEVKKASLLKYTVSLAAAIVLGFGVNIVTSTPYDWKGWVIVTMSIIFAIVAFFIPREGF